MMAINKIIATGICMFLLLISGLLARAQNYPTKTVQIIVPYAPGGQGDITARLVGEHLGSQLSQPVIVENRPGANGTIGASLVAGSAPDGHTLAVVVQSHIFGKMLMPDLIYDPVNSFEPVSLMARTQIGVVIPASLNINNLQEFVAYVKQRPGMLGFASAGHGSNTHIFAEWFLDMAGLDMIHVPYAGSAAAHPDLINGTATMAFDTLASVKGLVNDGRLKLLAVAGQERSPEFPSILTIAEVGYEGYAASSWSAMLVPAGTPQHIIDRLNNEISKILQRDDVKGRLASLGATVVDLDSAQAKTIMQEEALRYGALIERLNLRQE